MTEPSEAAKLKARELYRDIWPDSASYQHDYTSARRWSATLARVLQEHSDKAKIARDWDSGHAEARLALESIILPDEPCEHVLSYAVVGAVEDCNQYPALKCTKCGKRLKIVEVGDD